MNYLYIKESTCGVTVYNANAPGDYGKGATLDAALIDFLQLRDFAVIDLRKAAPIEQAIQSSDERASTASA